MCVIVSKDKYANLLYIYIYTTKQKLFKTEFIVYNFNLTFFLFLALITFF